MRIRQYRGEVLRSTMALEPVEVPAPFCQQTAKTLKVKDFLQQIKDVLLQGMPEALLHPNSSNSNGKPFHKESYW